MSRPIIGYIVDAATRLFTSRKIGGVDFDGTKDINLPGVNQPGNQNTSGNAASATRLQTTRKIGGVDFNGTEDITLPGVNAMGNQSTSGNAASATRLQTGRRINGTLFNGTADIITQQWGSGRSFKVGNTTRSVDGSENITWTLEDIGVGTVGRLNTNGNLTNFLRGDGTWARVEIKDTTYTAGSGLTLNGTEFSLPVSVAGTGSFVTGVEQTPTGLRISLGTPPDTNTTYTEVTEAEISAGTSATLRVVTGRRMKFAVDTFGLKLGTTATTAKPGNWLPNASEIPALDTSKITTGIFPLARLPDSGVSEGAYGSALEIPVINVDVKGRITTLSTANIPTATTGVAGLTRLSAAINSTATNMAATPSAVKKAYDLANAAIPASRIGIAGGIAPLDEHGLLSAEFLPSFVDDVMEYADYDSLPATGERGKIYVTVDNDRIFRWSGTGYIWINQSSSSSDTAVRLATARTISITGDGSWSTSFNGAANATGVLTLASTGVSAGSYGSEITIPVITVDIKGRITQAGTAAIRTATTGRTGVVQLNNTLTSTSTVQALTAAQGKVLQDGKVDKVSGKELSTNDFTNALLDKLTDIQAGAQVNVPTNLSVGGSGNDRTIVSSTGGSATLPLAAGNSAGLMSIADKAKLDGLGNYTAGPGLTLTGRQFSVPVDIVGTGTFIQSVEQTASGIKITKGTPPNSNTTYTEIPEAEVTAGTASTARSISGRRLKQAVDVHGLKLGSTAATARPGNWVPTWNDVTSKPAFIGAGTTQVAARAAIGAGTSSLTLGTVAGTAAAGNDSRINNGQTAFGWGNHSLAGYVKTDTTYTAGDGITLTGNVFSLPVSISGSGTFVTSVIQTSNGIEIRLGTPPNTNTTYAEIPEAEVTAGTAATLRTISARRLKFAIDAHGLKIGTAASEAKAGNWVPSWDDVTGKPVVIAAGTTQAAARQAIGAGTSNLTLGTAAGTAAAGNDSRINNGQTAFSWGNHASAGYVKTDTTYAEIPSAEVTAGTAATLRAISGRRLKEAVVAHGLKIGTTASTAKAGNWTPAVADVPNLPASKVTSGVFAAARIPTLNQNTTGSAATLTTARSLTIGASSKTFNGSANVTWTLAEMGAVSQTAFDTALGDIESVLLTINGEAP